MEEVKRAVQVYVYIETSHRANSKITVRVYCMEKSRGWQLEATYDITTVL